MKPAWLIPKKKPKTSKMSTRNIVRKHLKEWNKDDIDEEIKADEQLKADEEEKRTLREMAKGRKIDRYKREFEGWSGKD